MKLSRYQKTQTITNFWKTIYLRCGAMIDNEPCKEAFVLVPGSETSEPYYRCPKCGTVVPYFPTSEFVYSLMNMLIEDEDDGCDTNLTYTKAVKQDPNTGKSYTMTVVAHRPGKIKVEIIENVPEA